jgi:hypothetical protein
MIADGTAGLTPVPHDGAEVPSPEYDPRTTFVGGTGPAQVAVPFATFAVHRGLRPAEKTTVPVGPAGPVTDAE